LITSQVKGYPFEVRIPEGLPIEGVIVADQVKSLDLKARQAEPICRLPRKTVREALLKLNALLSP